MLIFFEIFVFLFYSLNAYINIEDNVSLLCNSTGAASKNCYCSAAIPYLPNIEDLADQIPENSIFFFDYTCNEGLDVRQLCSVEAAARANPDREVNVLFAGPITSYTSETWELLRIVNINLYRVNLPKFLELTPLEALLPGQDKCPVQSLTDVVKFLTLYKFGGIFLDFGIITTKSFDSLPLQDNWIVNSDDTRNTKIISLSRDGLGRMISELALRRLLINFKFKDWTDRYNDILIEVLMHICGTAIFALMTPDKCRGFYIDNHFNLYKIPYEQRRFWFDSSGEPLVPPDPMAFYVSDFSVYNYTVHEHSRFTQLMKQQCPGIHLVVSKHNLFRKKKNRKNV